MASAFRAAQGSNNGSGGTSLTMTKPAGVVDGDVMLMAITARGGTGTTISAVATIVAAPEVGVEPFNLAITPDGTYVYVCNSADGTVSVIQTSDNTVVDTVTVGSNPTSLAVTPDSAYVYVCNNDIDSYDPSPGVSVIRTSDNTVVDTVTVVSHPNYLAITPDGAYVYVCNYIDPDTEGSVSVIRTSDNTVVDTVAVVAYPSRIIITPDGAYVYVHGFYNVSVIRTSDNTVVDTLEFVDGAGNGVSGLDITSDGAYVYVAESLYLYNGYVSVVRTSDNKVVARVEVGETPAKTVLTPDGAYAYVMNWDDGTVSVIQTSNFTVVDTVTVGSNPSNIAVTPDGAYVYVCNGAADTVSVIRTSDNTVETITVGSGPNGLAITPDGAYVYVASIDATPNPRVSVLAVWTELGSVVNSTTTLAQRMFWRVASNEPSSYAVELSPSVLASGEIIALSGMDATAPSASQFSGQANSSSTNIVAPAISDWTSSSGIDVGMFGTAYGSTTVTPPGSYTEPTNGEAHSTGTTTATTTQVSYRALTAVQAVAAITAVAVNAAVNIGHHVFIKEAFDTTQVGVRHGVASNNGTGSNALSLTTPTGVVNGDILVTAITVRGGSARTVQPSRSFFSSANTGPYSNYMQMDPAGRYVYVCENANGYLSRYVADIPSSVAYIDDITTSSGPGYFALSRDGTRAYLICTNAYPRCLDVMDLVTMTRITSIDLSVDSDPYDVIVGADGAYVYVTVDSVITRIRTSDNTVLDTFALDTSYYSTSGAMSLSPDGRYLYVAESEPAVSSHLVVIDTTDFSEAARIALNYTGARTIVSPDGSHVYVDCYGSTNGHVSVIQTSDNTLVTDVTVGSGWGELAISNSGSHVYRTNLNDGTVSVIRTSDNTVTHTVTCGSLPTKAVVTKDDSLVYVINQTSDNVTIIQTSDHTVASTESAVSTDPVGIVITPPSVTASGDQSIYVLCRVYPSFSRLVKYQHRQLTAPVSNARVDNGTTVSQLVYWKVAQDEPGSYEYTFDDVALASGTMIAIYNAEPEAPIAAEADGQANASSTTVTAPALGTFDITDGIDLGLFGTAYESTFTPPTDYIEPYAGDSKSTGTSNATTSQISHRLLTNVTTVGSIYATAANAALNVGHHFFVKKKKKKFIAPGISMSRTGLV